MFEQMLAAIGDSLSDIASFDDGEDGNDEYDEATVQGKLSENDEPGCMMGNITKTVQQHMNRFRQKQMKLDKLTQPGWENAAEYFREQDTKYGTCQLSVRAIIQPHTTEDTLAPPPPTFRELLQRLDIVPGISQMPQRTSRPEISHIRLDTVKPQSKSSIACGEPAAEPDLSMLLKAKPVEPVSFCTCI
jgi:hypothetical protein